MPSISGMAKSRKTKSGLSSRNFFTPELPFSASPHTVHRELTNADSMRKEVPDSTGTFKVGDGWAIVKEDTLDGVLGTEPDL